MSVEFFQFFSFFSKVVPPLPLRICSKPPTPAPHFGSELYPEHCLGDLTLCVDCSLFFSFVFVSAPRTRPLTALLTTFQLNRELVLLFFLQRFPSYHNLEMHTEVWRGPPQHTRAPFVCILVLLPAHFCVNNTSSLPFTPVNSGFWAPLHEAFVRKLGVF